jgi:hypothetical protein
MAQSLIPCNMVTSILFRICSHTLQCTCCLPYSTLPPYQLRTTSEFVCEGIDVRELL